MWVLTVWLMVDGAGAGLTVAHLLLSIGRATALFGALLVLRLASSALSLASGLSMAARRPQGLALAPAALVLSAVMTTVDVGRGGWSTGALAPYRWLIVCVVWMWAAAWSAALRRKR